MQRSYAIFEVWQDEFLLSQQSLASRSHGSFTPEPKKLDNTLHIPDQINGCPAHSVISASCSYRTFADLAFGLRSAWSLAKLESVMPYEMLDISLKIGYGLLRVSS